MKHLEFEQWVPFSVERVFLFFADPRNLARIMPASRQTRIDDLRLVEPRLPAGVEARAELAGAGTEIDTSFRVMPPLPFRARWIAQITEFEWKHHFADIQKQGPFKSWHHRHEFRAEEREGLAGTVVRDVIEYEVGFGPLGEIANVVVVERQMRRLFEERQQVLPGLLG